VPRRSAIPLLLVCALAAYGSLYPFNFVPPPSFEMALRAMLIEAAWWTSRGDVAGNVLLFVPIGLAISIATGGSSSIAARMGAWWVAAIFFAFALQLLQIYFPPRLAALADVVWNAVGAAIGIAIGRGTRFPRIAADRLALPAILVLVFWLGWRLWPYSPTLGWQNIKNALKPLVNLPAFNGWLFMAVAVSLPLLAAVLSSWARPRIVLVFIAAANVVIRPFLAGQVISVALIAGTVVGLLAGLIVLRAGTSRTGPVLVGGTMLWGSIEALRPFEFSAQTGQVHWVPFTAFLQGTMDINLASLCGAAFVTGALILIGERLGFALGVWCAVLTVWILALEGVQIWIPTRTADFTIGLFPAGWWLMHRFARRIGHN
jgi:VanZ family protein